MNIIEYFSGKKREIAHIYWLIVIPSIVVIWPEGAPAIVSKASAVIGIALSSIGYGHAGVKAVKAKKNGNAAKK